MRLLQLLSQRQSHPRCASFRDHRRWEALEFLNPPSETVAIGTPSHRRNLIIAGLIHSCVEIYFDERGYRALPHFYTMQNWRERELELELELELRLFEGLQKIFASNHQRLSLPTIRIMYSPLRKNQISRCKTWSKVERGRRPYRGKEGTIEEGMRLCFD